MDTPNHEYVFIVDTGERLQTHVYPLHACHIYKISHHVDPQKFIAIYNQQQIHYCPHPRPLAFKYRILTSDYEKMMELIMDYFVEYKFGLGSKDFFFAIPEHLFEIKIKTFDNMVQYNDEDY